MGSSTHTQKKKKNSIIEVNYTLVSFVQNHLPLSLFERDFLLLSWMLILSLCMLKCSIIEFSFEKNEQTSNCGLSFYKNKKLHENLENEHKTQRKLRLFWNLRNDSIGTRILTKKTRVPRILDNGWRNIPTTTI